MSAIRKLKLKVVLGIWQGSHPRQKQLMDNVYNKMFNILRMYMRARVEPLPAAAVIIIFVSLECARKNSNNNNNNATPEQ